MDPMGKETFFHISWSRPLNGSFFVSLPSLGEAVFQNQCVGKMYVVYDMVFWPMKEIL